VILVYFGVFWGGQDTDLASLPIQHVMQSMLGDGKLMALARFLIVIDARRVDLSAENILVHSWCSRDDNDPRQRK
jgi:hypothetical protein